MSFMGTTNLDSLTSKGSVNYMALSLLLDSFFILFFTNVGWLTVFRIEGGTETIVSLEKKRYVLASSGSNMPIVFSILYYKIFSSSSLSTVSP